MFTPIIPVVLACLPAALNYSISGTASNGPDYTSITTSITIPANDTYADVTIAAATGYV